MPSWALCWSQISNCNLFLLGTFSAMSTSSHLGISQRTVTEQNETLFLFNHHFVFSPFKDTNVGSGSQEETRHIFPLYLYSLHLWGLTLHLDYSHRFPPPAQVCSLRVTFASPCALTSLAITSFLHLWNISVWINTKTIKT